MLLKYRNSNNEDVIIQNDLIIKDHSKNEIRVYKNDELVQVLPFLESIEIIEFDDSDRPKTTEQLLGEQLVQIDIKNMQLETNNNNLGNQVVDHDIRLMMGGL